MATLASLRAAARRLGAVTEDHCGCRVAEYQVAAPAGKVWACTGDIHWLVLNWDTDGAGRPLWPTDRDAAIADAIERINYGVVDCDDPECEVCQ